MVSAAVNGAIFLVTLVITLTYLCRKDGKWSPETCRFAFRFFTVQSNVLCAVTALIMCVYQLAGDVPRWVWALKYIGTAAVSLTMVTVFVYLAPMLRSLSKLLSKQDFFLHFLTPAMALVSFCVFERRGMDFPTALLGMLPLLYYGPLYLHKVIYAPEGKRWDDFYAFNKGGKWPLAFALMAGMMFLICMGIMGLQNV